MKHKCKKCGTMIPESILIKKKDEWYHYAAYYMTNKEPIEECGPVNKKFSMLSFFNKE